MDWDNHHPKFYSLSTWMGGLPTDECDVVFEEKSGRKSTPRLVV
jgi:hypothetical protein